uniref:Rho GTPase activating protein 31 n=1 Tax=Sphaeramia orbicularis TaxID=375764 RepID=A0A672ZPB6_9TELE
YLILAAQKKKTPKTAESSFFPQVLKKCAEFIEEHGIVDGIYRLSGITSNIQRLRQEFCSEACPDLTKEVYLQDIHCVGSLCKLYFRELPNPLLTYELYNKFTHFLQDVKHLYEPCIVVNVTRGFICSRTLEYLTKHLAHLATLSTETNMHTRNLALVWAPNLLRSKDIESSSGNGDMAFQEVRIQQSVVEFILNHTEQIFNRPNLMCGEKYATLPISGQCGPMKLMSLEEAQARSLSPNHPVHRERQRENSLPDTSTATLYHTVIDISDSKRKLSGKSKKWKSIFNLGRSVDSKGKLSRNGSVFIRAQGITEKAALRPSRSMESLCSLPTGNSPTGGPGSLFVPDVKSRTLGSDSLYDLNEHEQNWEFKGKKAGGATGGWSSNMNQKGSPSASVAPQKTLPEQLKVFKGDDLRGYQPTSPKNRRMLYSGSSHNSSSRPSFPGSFFPLESSPRHQRRAVNISEPFAVSVPLRVSAVISSNSTPCRGLAKDKAAALKPCKETPEPSSNSGKNEAVNVVTEDDEVTHKTSEIPEIPHKDKSISCDAGNKNVIPEIEVFQRLSVCLEERRNILELPNLEDEYACGGISEELDLVEPWEDLSATKQWVTSPLHSPDVEELFKQLSCSGGEPLSSEEGNISPPISDTNKQANKTSLTKSFSGNILQTSITKPETKWMYLPTRISNNTAQPHAGKCKQKNTENSFSKHRPYSLNLDLGYRCIRDISNQQNHNSSEFSSCQKGSLTPSGTVSNGLPSDLELFLNDRQAPLRRNSAPVSVTSVRTAFMIKTCQAKAVPVIPPKVQYSQIPHSKQDKDSEVVNEPEKEKMSTEKSNTAPPQMMSELKEEHPNVEKSAESVKTTSTQELPVIKRRHPPSLEVFVDGPRPNRANLLQRPSFRKQRPQSLILLSPPFPIMDYPSSGDDGKLLSSIKSLNDTSAVFSKEMAENFRTPEGIALQNKMTIPKSGQRLETSTSCFYQPQRRSMIFDNRSQRQIE